jgi:hypothetical protein
MICDDLQYNAFAVESQDSNRTVTRSKQNMIMPLLVPRSHGLSPQQESGVQTVLLYCCAMANVCSKC